MAMAVRMFEDLGQPRVTKLHRQLSLPTQMAFESRGQDRLYLQAVVVITALSSGNDVCQAVDHGCENLCVSSGESYTCKCQEGFRLAEDGKHCRSKWTQWAQIFSSSSHSSYVELVTMSQTQIPTLGALKVFQGSRLTGVRISQRWS